MTWPLLGLLIFIGLCALFTGWLLNAAQNMLDRQWNERLSEEKMRQAMKRLPP